MKATTTYYIAISVYLICLVVIAVKMTFWPVCTSASTCDGWTIAGLAAMILGVTAAFLAILGAVFFAAWWTGLDKRVEERVTEAFNTQIQSVKSTIGQLDTQVKTVQDSLTQLSMQAVALQKKADNLEASIQKQEEQTLEQVKRIENVLNAINDLGSKTVSLNSMIEKIAQDIHDLTVQTQVAQTTATLALQETQPPYKQIFADHLKAKQQEQGE